METFVWNPLFETGIPLVDEQHRHLVDIVNQLGERLILGSAVGGSSLEKIFAELAAYAQQHFTDEERLMRTAGLQSDYIEAHARQHQEFVRQLGDLWQRRAQLLHAADALHGFLSSWLTFHILGDDHVMAHRIHALHPHAGTDSAADVSGGNASAVLLSAMHQLYQVLSQQNKALVDANALLEQQVRVRTRDLLQAEKMAAVGQLAAGVAHEINNPIGYVNANLGTLNKYAQSLLALVDGCAAFAAQQAETADHFQALTAQFNLPFLRSDLGALLDESRDGLERVKSVVQSLSDFAQADCESTHEVNLLSALESTLVFVAREHADRVDIVRQLTPLPPIRCIPGQINQVFMNVLVNATQAITGVGEIRLSSGFDDKQVWIKVTDSGCGIAEDQIAHVFEPFYTSKPVGSGTGLGLATAWDIVVNKHGGQIELQSQVGLGTQVTLRLPR